MSNSTFKLKSDRLARIGFSLLFLAGALHLVYHFSLVPVIGHDDFLHLTWLEDYVKLRQSGITLPRWLPDSFAGLGSPTFYFYPPLSYLIADLLASFGLTSIGQSSLGTVLFHGVTLITLLLSGATCFWFLRRHLSASLALVGCGLYMFAPYRYADVFTRAALGEHVAFAWIPVLLIAADLAIGAKDRAAFLKGIVLSSIGWSLLILSNIPATVVAAVLLLAYLLPGIRSHWKQASALVVGGVVAGLLTSFYLLTLIEFRDQIQTANLWNFDLSISRWHHVLLEIFDPNAKRTAVHLVAIVSFVILAILMALILRWRVFRDLQRWMKGLIVAGGASLFLQLPFISDPLWDIAAPLHLLQFSWRFTIAVTLVLAGLIPAALQLGHRKAGFVLLAVAATSFFFYARYGYVITTFPPAPYQVGPLRQSANEYINKFVNVEPDSLLSFVAARSSNPILSATVGMRSKIEFEHADTLAGYFDAEQPFDLHIRRLWWPQWRIEIIYATPDRDHTFAGNRKPVEADSNGLIVVRGLDGKPSRFLLTMEKSPAEESGELISLFGVGVLSLLCLYGFTHTHKKLP